MAITTRTITCKFETAHGIVIPNVNFSLTLTVFDIENGSVISLSKEHHIADGNGVKVLTLWDNDKGRNSSTYSITAYDPLTGKRILDQEEFVVDGADAYLADLLGVTGKTQTGASAGSLVIPIVLFI